MSELFDFPAHPIQEAIDTLMAVCDGAKTQDGVGFSKADVGLIKYDAAPDDVLQDAALAKRLCKYHRQLGEYLTNKLKNLSAMDLKGAEIPANLPGVLYVEEDYLKLYGDNGYFTDQALKKAGAAKFKHADGFKYVAPHERVLNLQAAGFRVADRVIDWCARHYGS